MVCGVWWWSMRGCQWVTCSHSVYHVISVNHFLGCGPLWPYVPNYLQVQPHGIGRFHSFLFLIEIGIYVYESHQVLAPFTEQRTENFLCTVEGVTLFNTTRIEILWWENIIFVYPFFVLNRKKSNISCNITLSLFPAA